MTCPIPIERIPASRAPTSPTSRRSPTEVGYVFYVDPGPAPGHEHAYWGPEIKVGAPQPALNVDMDALHQRREPDASASTGSRTRSRSSSSRNEQTKVVDPDPDPADHAANPPLGPDPAAAAKHRDLQPVGDDLSKRPIPQAIMIGPGVGRAVRADAVTGEGTLDVAALRPRAAGARSWSACAARARRSTACTTSRSVPHEIKRGEYKQSFTPEPQRPGVHRADGGPVSSVSDDRTATSRFYGKYRGTVSTTSTRAARPDPWRMVPDVLGLDPVQLGDALRAAGGQGEGIFVVPPIGAGVWIEFEQGDPDYPIWIGGFWGSVGRGAAAGAGAAADPARPEHRAADHRPEHRDAQRQRPAPHRRDHAARARAGAMLVRQRHRRSYLRTARARRSP